MVLDVGATHAFGGLLPTLAAARSHLAADGCVVVGDGFWEREPSHAALSALDASPDEFDDLPTTVERITRGRLDPRVRACQHPRGMGRLRVVVDGVPGPLGAGPPGTPGQLGGARAAATHREQWLRGYRGTLGFVTLLLRRS